MLNLERRTLVMSEQVPEWKPANRKYDAQVDEPFPERDWPTWQRVVEEHPDLCGEEQAWILEALINQAHQRRADADN